MASSNTPYSFTQYFGSNFSSGNTHTAPRSGKAIARGYCALVDSSWDAGAVVVANLWPATSTVAGGTEEMEAG